MTELACPFCGQSELPLFVSAADAAVELELRERFFRERLSRRFAKGELKDISNVTFGEPSAIHRCPRCGILIRDMANADATFREDSYETRALEAIHDSHYASFRRRQREWTARLPRASRVAEIGSYVGAFLRVGAERGWDITGIDIGGDTGRFARRLGFGSIETPFEDCAFDSNSMDAVFIWNCFEQLNAPQKTLKEVARVLKSGRRALIRVPDAALYAHLRERRSISARRLLAYNGFLGWPHRFGFDLRSLRAFGEANGLRFVSVRRSAAMRPHREWMMRWARQEEASAMARRANRGWLEVTFEKATSAH